MSLSNFAIKDTDRFTVNGPVTAKDIQRAKRMFTVIGVKSLGARKPVPIGHPCVKFSNFMKFDLGF